MSVFHSENADAIDADIETIIFTGSGRHPGDIERFPLRQQGTRPSDLEAARDIGHGFEGPFFGMQGSEHAKAEQAGNPPWYHERSPLEQRLASSLLPECDKLRKRCGPLLNAILVLTKREDTEGLLVDENRIPIHFADPESFP
jgi:hypothetical protein